MPKISELTNETALAAVDEFVMSDGSTSRAASFALMGGLEIDTSYNSAADHSDISAAAGKLYLVNLSSVTTNNLVFTLPVAASVQTGERVGVHITATNASFELDLKSGASLDLINGTDHSSTAWSNIWIVGETVVFRCIDGSTGDWIVEYDGRVPCYGHVELSTTYNIVSASTYELLPFNDVIWDVGDCFNTGAYFMYPRRNGRYRVNAIFRTVSSYTNDQARISIRETGNDRRLGYSFMDDYSGFLQPQADSLINTTTSDYFGIYAYVSDAAAVVSDGFSVTWFEWQEVLEP